MGCYVSYDRNRFYYIAHHGILGQKWGVRRFQNADRTWTAAGKERYGNNGKDDQKPRAQKYRNADGTLTSDGRKKYGKDLKKFDKRTSSYEKRKKKYDRANARFEKRAKRIAVTDTGVELKRRAGLKLARRYRSYSRSGERLYRTYSKMVNRYGVDSLSKNQIALGEEIAATLLKKK